MKKSTFCSAMFAKSTHSLTKLRMRKGYAGLGIYMCILEALYDEPTAILPREYDVIAFRFGINEDEVRSIIEDFGLFEFTDDGMFYCELLRAERLPKQKRNEKPTEEQPLADETTKTGKTCNPTESVQSTDRKEEIIKTLHTDKEWQQKTAASLGLDDTAIFMNYFQQYIAACEENGFKHCDAEDLKNSFIMWLSSYLRAAYSS